MNTTTTSKPLNRKFSRKKDVHSAVLKGVAWLGLSKIIINMYTFVVHIYVISYLVPEDYALFALGLLVINFSNFIHDFGFGVVVIQQNNITTEELNSIFWFTLLIGTGLYFICFASAPGIEIYFEKTGLASIIKTLAWVLVLRAAAVVPFKMLGRKLKFNLSALVNLISKFVSLSTAGVLAFFGFGIWALVYAQIINAIFIVMLSYYFEPFKPTLKLNIEFIKKISGFGLNIIALRITWYFRNNIDKIMGGKLFSNINFGYYSLGFRLAETLVDVVKGVTNTISLPLLSKNNREPKKVNDTYLKIVKYCSLVTFPIFIGGTIIGNEIIHILLPEKWFATGIIFQAVCFIHVFRIMSSPNEDLFVALGKPKISFVYNLLTIPILSLAFIIGIQWGINGVLFALVIVITCIYIIWNFITLKYRGISWRTYMEQIMPAMIGSGFMAMIVYGLKKFILLSGEFNKILSTSVLVMIIITGGLFYLLVVHLYDKSIIRSVIISGNNDQP